jgi:broad specificity phosphatase PhoE
MMWNRLYLVRHGENVANLTKEFSYRQVDYALTANDTARWRWQSLQRYLLTSSS